MERNEHKFCFIICSNSTVYLEECLHYLNHLVIPERYETELLTISDAVSMTSGYNQAMRSSDAKYKIYMHQDVFILNRNFLQDILDIFARDSRIGMIGLVGYKRMAQSFIMWQEDRVGVIYRGDERASYPRLDDYHFSVSEDGVEPVNVIDGLLMATNVDITWDEEFDGWDFYDASQSRRFIYEGYRIVVPRQHHPWCLHDAGTINNMNHYDKYRQLYKKKYGFSEVEKSEGKN